MRHVPRLEDIHLAQQITCSAETFRSANELVAQYLAMNSNSLRHARTAIMGLAQIGERIRTAAVCILDAAEHFHCAPDLDTVLAAGKNGDDLRLNGLAARVQTILDAAASKGETSA